MHDGDKNILNNSDRSDEILSNIDLEKLGNVIRKSWISILIIVSVCIMLSYVAVHYITQVYESTSEIKLDIKKDANALGIGFSSRFDDEQNVSTISSEIELIRSKLFFKKLIQNQELQITYFPNYGRFKNLERYKNSPFRVEAVIKHPSFYDYLFEIELLNDKEFTLKYTSEGVAKSEEVHFGELIDNDNFSIRVFPTSKYQIEEYKEFAFVINSEKSILKFIRDNLTVQPANLNANTISVSFKDPNRMKAYDLVRAIDSLYLAYTNEEKRKANQQKIDFLNTQLKATADRLENYEDYFENFTIENKTTDMKSDISRSIEGMVKLDSQKIAYESRLKSIDLLIRKIESNDLQVLSTNYSDDIDELMESLYELDKERQLLLGSYNENTFAVKKKVDELSHLKGQLLEVVENERELVSGSLEEINTKLVALEGNFIGLPSKGTEFTKSKRFYELYEEFFLSLMQKKAEFEIEQAGTVTNYIILSEANIPDSPISPNKMMIYGIGVVSSLILSFVIIGVRYLMENKISSVSELEKMTSSPILGMVPKYTDKALKTTKLVITMNSRSMLSESLRSIRTNMEFLQHDKAKKVISITSTISGEGKTFVAVNLGAIIALSNQKVIVVDLDLRRPKIHKAFDDQNGTKGISTILINKHKLSECIHQTEIENLHYLTAGPVPPNPSELILTDGFSSLLEKLKQDYDVVILDTPPVGLVTDGVLVMKKADLPIFIVRADYSKKDFVKMLNRLITVNKFSNLSVILNSVSSSMGSVYGYGKGKVKGYYVKEDHSNGQDKKSKKLFSSLKDQG